MESAYKRADANELAEPVSPHASLGWVTVDEHIAQLKARFRTAVTAIDYKDVGNRCVGVLEAISAHVFEPEIHGIAGKPEPPVDRTDVRIGAYIDARLAGHNNAALRGLSKKASVLAHNVKHSPTADRTSAGIAADSVILLANILRRLQEEA